MAVVVMAAEEVPTAAGRTAAARTGEGPPTAVIAVVAEEIMATVVATEACAATPIRPAVPPPAGRGRQRAEVLATPRRDGIPSADPTMPDQKAGDRTVQDRTVQDRTVQDRPGARAFPHLAVRVARQPAVQPLPMVNSIPSAAPAAPQHQL